MKKIFLSADIEGTCGVAHWDETEFGKQGYEHFAKQMSREVSAACKGALAGGAEEIFVKDAHDFARNIDPSMLPEEACIFRGWGSDPYSMMSGVDESFDGLLRALANQVIRPCSCPTFVNNKDAVGIHNGR